MAIWKLYWVESDGYEDYFVVAKNSRSAKSVEIHMNGFDSDEVTATRILDIPDKYEKIANAEFLEWSKVNAPAQANNDKLKKWPWYADKWLLEKLGAKFRTYDDKQQTLLRDVVYSAEPTGQKFVYTIGAKALSERNPELPLYDNYENEPEIDIQNILHQAMGLAMTKCHEIETLFSRSFVFGVSEKQKKKYDTILDFFKGWEKKTFGNLIRSMQESFEIDDEVNQALTLFLDMRNQLVHGITTKPRYDISTDWGQRELIAFLDVFLTLCVPILTIAASCFEFSIAFGNEYLIGDHEEKMPIEQNDDLLSLFIGTFKLKDPET